MALTSKVAVVTGSTSGIGLGIARELASKGCAVVLTGLADDAVIQSLIAEFSRLNEQSTFVPCDLLHTDSIHQFCQNVIKLHPSGIDILVNNAGIQHVAPVEEFPDEKWDAMMAIMMSAPFHLIKFFLPFMKQKGWGRIVNISSMMGVISAEGKAPYSAVKAGLLGLTRGVALEAAPHGVTCNAICPGFAYTHITEGQVRTYQKDNSIETYEEAKTKFFARHPTKKPVEIGQISELVGFLCSGGASNMTGSPIMMEGGFTIQ